VDTPKLELRNLVRRFGGRAVVDQVSLSVAPGQVTCLLGPSGCGKSTTLRMIAGVESQDSGEILVDGRTIANDAESLPPEERQIGLMFQDFALFPHLKVSENVGFGLNGDRRAARDRVQTLLQRVGLDHYSNAYPHELSGGEQQRVALARALAPRPNIMLMDEPFSGLDNRLRDGIRDHTLEILRGEGTAVLLVTHEPEEAMRMADTIALMRAGRIVQQGTPYALYNKPVDRNAVAFFSDINVVTGSVKDGLVDTPFGSFDAPDIADGNLAEIVVRPQHVAVEFFRDGHAPAETPSRGLPVEATIERARFMGGSSLLEMRLSPSGELFRASLPGVFMPERGARFWLTIRRERCFVFPAG
jgi:iron(III) transport system ATP-binding protein